LSLAGFLNAQNRFSFPLVLIATTLGSLLSALLLYAVGMASGQRGVPRLFDAMGT
jgi:membrane protein DedA with SNARE-associated domain